MGGVAVTLYYVSKNDDLTARIIADYHNGKGLRLTSYESDFDVRLFKPVNYMIDKPLSNIANPIKAEVKTFD